MKFLNEVFGNDLRCAFVGFVLNFAFGLFFLGPSWASLAVGLAAAALIWAGCRWITSRGDKPLYVNWPFLREAAFALACVLIPFYWLGYVLYALWVHIFVPPGEPSQPQAGRRLLTVEEAETRADELARTGRRPEQKPSFEIER